MPVAYVVTPEVLSKFKEPFGILIEGSFTQTMQKLKELLRKKSPL